MTVDKPNPYCQGPLLQMFALKYQQVFPVLPWARGSEFYLGRSVRLPPHAIGPREIFHVLQNSNHNFVFPSHILAHEKLTEILNLLTPFRERLTLQIPLGHELPGLWEKITTLAQNNWQIQLTLLRPLDENLSTVVKNILALEIKLELVVLASCFIRVEEILESLPRTWLEWTRISFNESREANDNLLSSQDIMWVSEELRAWWQKRVSTPVPLLVYQGHAPEVEIAVLPFSPFCQNKLLRLIKCANIKNRVMRFFVLSALLFVEQVARGLSFLLRPGLNGRLHGYLLWILAWLAYEVFWRRLCWPFRKLYWFLAYQCKKRLLKSTAYEN